MTDLQYQRWKDFSLRMARTCFRTHRRPSAAWIAEVVEDWFGRLDANDIPCIVDWDNSTEYPEGNPRYGREPCTSYCGCDGWRYEHKKPNPECPECHGSGLHHRLYEGYCAGDLMSLFLDDWCGPAPWCPACQDDEREEGCTCREVEHRHWEQWSEQWGGPVRCCVRAGLDMASAPSAGVIGFTAGDIRRMYPEGVPEWLFPPGERLSYWPGGEPDGTFVELADEAVMAL